MGAVYAVEQISVGRQVAIKVIHGDLVRREGLADRFRQEARVQGRLNHSNVVVVLDFVENPDGLFIIQELVDGRPLSEIIGREVGPIPAERALAIFGQLLAGVGAAHEAGIVHRDLKPANVMVTNDDHAKVVDFGIAKVAGGGQKTTTGVRLGTLHYMAPEQVMMAPVDRRADIYALGIVLYKMLCGRLPFEERFDPQSDYVLMERIVREPLPDPRTIYPSIPSSFVAAIAKATNKEPSRRWQSCSAFAAALSGKSRGGVSDARMPRIFPRAKQEDSAAAIQGLGAVSTGKLGKYGALLVGGVSIAWGIGALWEGRDPSESVDVASVQAPLGSKAVTETPVEEHLLDGASALKGRYREGRNSIGMNMVLISAGSFMMGSPEAEAGRLGDEARHQVTLTRDYLLADTEITQAQWRALMEGNHSRFPGDQNPVENVSWPEAVDFCNRLSLRESLRPAYALDDDRVRWIDDADGYRLPTEAEWEFACWAGDDGVSGGGDLGGNLERLGWYSWNSMASTHPVGEKDPNDWGLYDMHGNVFEWCWDWYGPYQGSVVDPRGAHEGSRRVMRGGGWISVPSTCRPSKRNHGFPGNRLMNLGFRPVRWIGESDESSARVSARRKLAVLQTVGT